MNNESKIVDDGTFRTLLFNMGSDEPSVVKSCTLILIAHNDAMTAEVRRLEKEILDCKGRISDLETDLEDTERRAIEAESEAILG